MSVYIERTLKQEIYGDIHVGDVVLQRIEFIPFNSYLAIYRTELSELEYEITWIDADWFISRSIYANNQKTNAQKG